MRFQASDDPVALSEDLVIWGENLPVLERLPAGAFDLVYLDPPFNTGRSQARRSLATTADPDGQRIGFGGRRYRTELLGRLSYDDQFGDYLSFLEPRLARPASCWRPTARSTSTSTTGRRTTASCCWTRCSGARRSSTSSSGPTTTAPSHGVAGPPSTTRSWSTSAPREPITSTPTRSSASPTWPPAWSAPRRRPAASVPPTSGFTPSCRPTAPRRPGIRPRSRPASSAAWWPPRRGREAGAWIRSPARGRWGRCARSSGGGSS